MGEGVRDAEDKSAIPGEIPPKDHRTCAGRTFWLNAYPAQSHEMPFDLHARAFAAFCGVPRRGIYDGMKTSVDALTTVASAASLRRIQ